jgi:hypothetical protein
MPSVVRTRTSPMRCWALASVGARPRDVRESVVSGGQEGCSRQAATMSAVPRQHDGTRNVHRESAGSGQGEREWCGGHREQPPCTIIFASSNLRDRSRFLLAKASYGRMAERLASRQMPHLHHKLRVTPLNIHQP